MRVHDLLCDIRSFGIISLGAMRFFVCLFEMRCINFGEINMYTHTLNQCKDAVRRNNHYPPKNVYREFKFVSLLLAIDI